MADVRLLPEKLFVSHAKRVPFNAAAFHDFTHELDRLEKSSRR
jgi:hypothetical protein